MKSTGIVRKVDELGRVVLPIELRRNLDINEKDDWGQNAIFYVTKIEMARYLIYNDIDYKSRNSIGLKAHEVLKYNNKINVSNYLQKLYNDE